MTRKDTVSLTVTAPPQAVLPRPAYCPPVYCPHRLGSSSETNTRLCVRTAPSSSSFPLPPRRENMEERS
ncbi:hypothetical protein E2C01_051198 [Portunus trituberculatus]|uniref:Uncharacterized protein n=1 Tax=Portunus trituberculatus TaxID=210409 RepID=A0A5B7GE42_PORTR|nr:hypothetical protein [Portunus trituberculatus]